MSPRPALVLLLTLSLVPGAGAGEVPPPLLPDAEHADCTPPAAASGEPTPPGVPSSLHAVFSAGRDAILHRCYGRAEELGRRAEQLFPASPVGPLERMLAYQARMLENRDMRHESAFYQAGKLAQRRAREAVATPGLEAWDHLLLAAIEGALGLHEMRKDNLLGAARAGLAALRSLTAAEPFRAELPDLELGYGAYNYFRSVITKRVSWLPWFPDRRALGIDQIRQAAQRGALTGPVAELALCFLLQREHRPAEAIQSCEGFLHRYPSNILARQLVARSLLESGRLADAVEANLAILRLDPENRVVYFFLGLSRLYQQTDLIAAEQDLLRFLDRAPDSRWRGWGLERLGDVYYLRGDADRAADCWTEALALNPDDASAERKLERHHRGSGKSKVQ